MLIKIDQLIKKYNLKINGILHVGAHLCEELQDYKNVGVNENDIIWIEGNVEIYNNIKNKVKNVYNLLVSDKEEIVDFIITNNGQSSSILELDEHKKEHPHVHEIKRIKQKTETLQKFLDENIKDYHYNFLNFDIQGAELKALIGMGDYLNKVDYIYSEVNVKHLYKDCALIQEMDDYLSIYNFKRVETNILHHGWGDALYIKQ